MVVHYGIMHDYGNYEEVFQGCSKTLCGCQGEYPCGSATEVWNLVTCKKCLKLKGKELPLHRKDKSGE